MRQNKRTEKLSTKSTLKKNDSKGRNVWAVILSFALLAGANVPVYAQSSPASSKQEALLSEKSVLPSSEATDFPQKIVIAPPSPKLPMAGRRAAIDSPLLNGRSRVYYPYPWGAMAVSIHLNGKRVLVGEAADIGGTVYVPVQRYADLFGSFKTTYEEATEKVTIRGTNLLITVQVGDPYITVNERIFYTGSEVLSLGGWIFVPMEAMSRALGASAYIKKGYYEAYVTSGNPSAITWANDYYSSTDLYWLSRIISAEAKGEPLAGQIAVGNVVLNRKKSTSFPNTVKDVIFDKKYGVQFSPVSNGTIYHTPTTSAIIAAKICLEGYSLSPRILYFFNPSLTSATWISQNRPYIMSIGNHKFYG